MYDTAFFYIISTNFNSLALVKNKIICPLLVPAEFCTSSTFFTFSITLSSLLNPFPQMLSLKAPKRWNSAAARSGLYGGCGKTVHLSFVIAV
jgi:hypothetical protein